MTPSMVCILEARMEKVLPGSLNRPGPTAVTGARETMKRKKKSFAKRIEPTFRALSSKAWNMRRRRVDEETAGALEHAVNKARQLGFASMFDNLDKVLSIAEPWVDRDILRAHILKDGDPPPGAKFVVAFVPGDGQVIEPTRWYILPPAAAGEIEVRVIAIDVDEEHYDVLIRDGWEAFFSTMLSRLRDVGQEPLN